MSTNRRDRIGPCCLAAVPPLLAAVLGCAAGSMRSAPPPATSQAAGPFDADLLAAAAGYMRFSRVSDRAALAPFECRTPAPTPRRGQLVSTSGDTGTHGQKLYFLYASDGDAYERISSEVDTRSPVGQTLVKETWSVVVASWDFEPGAGRDSDPEAVRPRQAPMTSLADGHLPPTHVRDGDRVVMTDEPGDLFIMLKLDPSTPGTDEGWVYGVVSHDGSWVKSAGMIESCIGCHVKTGRDRLFGHPGSWPDR